MPQKILRDMKDKKLFKQKIKSEIYIFIGTQDNVVSNRWPIEFAKAQEAKIQFLHDDHSFTGYINQLSNFIKNII